MNDKSSTQSQERPQTRPSAGSPSKPRWLSGRGRLAQSLRLEEQGPGRLGRIAVSIIATTVVGFVVWAGLTKIGEVAPASGEVTPFGSVKRIQHLEGGIVSAIYVRDGDLVEQGQVLVKLESGMSGPELDQLQARLAGLELRNAQLQAAADQADIANGSNGDRYNQVATAQEQLLQSKRASLNSQVAVLSQQRQQRSGDLESLIEQEKGVLAQIAALNQQIIIRTETFKKGYTSRVLLLEQQRDLARIQTQLSELRGKIIGTREAIIEVDTRIAELRTKAHLDASQEIGKVTSEIAEVREGIEKAQDRVARLAIVAPVRGVIKGLQTETIGGVVAPGSTVLEVIPSDAQLIVEARVLPKDIGFVHKGQPALIKVGTYDYTRFGGIDGKIQTISATTFQDDKGNSFYRARIRLDRNYVGNDASRNRVIPGMTVLADIQTGDRTVLAYLLKPLVRASGEALRER